MKAAFPSVSAHSFVMLSHCLRPSLWLWQQSRRFRARKHEEHGHLLWKSSHFSHKSGIMCHLVAITCLPPVHEVLAFSGHLM